MLEAKNMGMNKEIDQYDTFDWDSGAVPDISTKEYKWDHLGRVLSCTYCPPHRNENGHWSPPRKKKAWQLNPLRRRELTRRTARAYGAFLPTIRKNF